MEHFYPAAPIAFNEKRRTLRQKAFTSAHVHFNQGCSSYEAIVKNVSASGARLRFGDVVELPAEFDIRVGQDGSCRKALVAWRHGFEIGVAFAS